MLKIQDRILDEISTAFLTEKQALIDSSGDYPKMVLTAKSEWEKKTNTNKGKAALKSIRETLGKMCVGSQRCAYCEDSAADEVEHIKPKNLFPEDTFRWSNYLFACGPCNGPKNDRYGTIDANQVIEFKRGRHDPVVRPPSNQSGFIDPRREDPFEFLELDLGGTTPNGDVLQGTFEMLARDDLTPAKKARAEFTISVLNLNREVIRKARETAFGGFRARMIEYVQKKENDEPEVTLEGLKLSILQTPHLSVFENMRRQRDCLPEVAGLIERAPEILTWDVVPV
ncbi:hypothetical protein [Thalassobius sp. MITS945101]|uniref:hypothetical protein n=1 Tax=Thalassobius sp. MITS945101 TaxID=3096994 RepID=UPI003999A846